MKNRFLQLFDQHLPAPGILACGVRMPDRSHVCQCSTAELSPAQVEQALNRLAIAADSLNHHRLEAQSFCWTFERIRVHLALRPDGSALIILAENTNASGIGATPTRLIEAFSRLPEN